MATELELLKQELYGDPENSIADISFYPGTSRDIGPEDVARAIRKSIAAIKAGDYEEVPLSAAN